LVIPAKFYQSNDVVTLAKELLGKFICTNFNGELTTGIISETEAYAGIVDKASHAYRGRRTDRNEVMYHEGGISYVYLCYGIHHLFNIVTGEKDIPHAVLIRGVFPTSGWEHITNRTGKKKNNKDATNGPGKFTKAFGITRAHNGVSLSGDKIWVEERKIDMNLYNLYESKRIGIDYAEEDAELLYRFHLREEISKILPKI
jgi:DNA-3-methyladenine glycosylase